MVEFDQNDGTVHAVIESGIGVRAADPCEICTVEMLAYFAHSDACMAVPQISDVFRNEFQKQAALLTAQTARRDTGVVQYGVVSISAGKENVPRFLSKNRLILLGLAQRAQQL
jgi:hypothetical protein